LDRRSGTGRGKEVRKEGGGRNNWGNLNDELKGEKYDLVVAKTEEVVVE